MSNILEFEVKGAQLRQKSGFEPVSGGVDYDECRFDFDGEMSETQITAVFFKNYSAFKNAEVQKSGDGRSGACKIPSGFTAGKLKVGLVVGNFSVPDNQSGWIEALSEISGSEAVMTTNIVEFELQRSAVSEAGWGYPQLDVYAQIIKEIKNLKVTTAKLEDSAVTTGKLADQAVTSEKIADEAIGKINITDGAVAPEKTNFINVSNEIVSTGAFENINTGGHQTSSKSGYIKIEPGTYIGEFHMQTVYCYDADKLSLGTADITRDESGNSFTTITGTEYVIIYANWNETEQYLIKLGSNDEIKYQLDESIKITSENFEEDMSEFWGDHLDIIVQGYLYENKFYKEESHQTEIELESGKIYIDLSTNKIYRFSDSNLVELLSSVSLGETEFTAYRGDRGKAAYDHSQSAHAPTNAEANVINEIKVNGEALAPNGKSVNIEIDDFELSYIELSTYTTSSPYIYYYDSGYTTKLDFEEGKLFSVKFTSTPSSGTSYSRTYFRITPLSGGSYVNYPVYIRTIDGEFIDCPNISLYNMYASASSYCPNDILCRFALRGTQKCILIVEGVSYGNVSPYAMPIIRGGTGATNAAQALENLEQDTGWKTLSLASSSYKTADSLSFQYRKRGSRVTLRGNINPQGSGFKVGTEYVVAKLPTGYRPQRTFYYIGGANGVSYTRWYITTSGEVRYVFHSGSTTNGATSSTTWASIWVEFDVD